MKLFDRLVAFSFIIGAAEGIDFQNIFRIVTGIGKKVSRAAASKCVEGSEKQICRFNSKALDLATGDRIQITVNEAGRRIICDRKKTRGKQNWYGSCDGDAEDANFVKLKDAEGVERIFGSIRVGNQICQIAPNIKGVDEITCRPESSFKDEKPPIKHAERKLDENEEPNTDNFVFGYSPSTNFTGGLRRDGGRSLYDDTGAFVDVMVVWTKEAECENAVLPRDCTPTAETDTKMRGLVKLAVAETNIALQLSGIDMQLRLVHAYLDSSYAEPTGDDAHNLALDSLRSTTDGALDTVHAKRALYGADAVVMLMSCKFYFSASARMLPRPTH